MKNKYNLILYVSSDIDFEMKNINYSIIGPVVVKTKLHVSTFINKKFAGENFKTNKKVISGRNISLVHDAWGSKQLINTLSKDNNLYKLRRYGNEKLIKK